MKQRLTVLILALAVPLAHGAEVLVKKIPAAPSADRSLYSENSTSPNYGSDTVPPSPGFRIASTSTHSFLVGYTHDGALEGFISKIDPAGSIVWTKTMDEVFGYNTGLGWAINDIAITQGYLYVCGNRSDGRGFVAKITSSGSIVDYTTFQANSGAGVATPRVTANAVSASTVGGQTRITVGGGALGQSSMKVNQREHTGSTTTFDGMVLRPEYGGDYREDAYVVQLDGNLSATWANTYGFPHSIDSFSAVASDDTGAIFAALKCENPDRKGDSKFHDIDDNRKIFTSSTPGGVNAPANGNYENYDYWGGSQGYLIRVDSTQGTAAEITTYFAPCKIEQDEHQSNNRITDLVYDNGFLYAAGEWRKRLRPMAYQQAAQGAIFSSRDTSNAYTSDIWVAKLNATTLHHSNWQILRSAKDDFVNGLSVHGDSVYLAATAGAAMEQMSGILSGTGVLTDSNPGSSIGGSTQSYLFWAKLNSSDLSYGWRERPVENGDITIPGLQRVAGVGRVGSTLIIAGSWKDGEITFGGVGTNEKTLANPGSSRHDGFVGFLQPSGTWLEQVSVTIGSEYGRPTPHLGTDTVAAGQSITARVAPIVYEDAAGNILDPEDSALIRTQAITRRICTGYQFRNSTENGTSNTVTFAASADTEINFLWRTEHAIQVDADVASVDGLTSKSAGNPSPQVNKHWIEEGESFVASVDGVETDPGEFGTRWRSLGYQAEGVVAEAAGVSSGDWVRWPELQNRQQTPEVIVNGPGKVTWQWRKEHSLRQSVNSSVADGAPLASWSRNPGTHLFDIGYVNPIELIRYPDAPVTRDTLVVTFNNADPADDPAFIKIEVGMSWWNYPNVALIPVPSVPQGQTQRLHFPPMAGKFFRIRAFDESDNEVATSIVIGGLAEEGSLSGAGEFWAPAGVGLTLSSETSVDSGLSTLDLNGYNTGQGAVQPSAVSGITSKSITLDQPSSITWDYARAIYDETVELGDFITFDGVTGADAGRIDRDQPPVAGNVSSGPNGSTFGDMQIWDEVEGRLLALRPGTFTAEFQNTAAPDDPAQNIIVRLTVDWPSVPDYTHILETPPVGLDPSTTDRTAFVRIAHTESLGTVSGAGFTASEPGRSVLLFSQRSSGEANGDLERESLVTKVVNSINWESSAGDEITPVTIGEHLTSGDHDSNAVGHNGHVIHDRAPVNANIYDPASNAGPIIPINEAATTSFGMIAHFPLDEGSGSVTIDRVTQTEATLTSGTYWANPGVDLWPNYSERVQSDPVVGNGVTNRLTLAAWIEPDTFPEWGGIITKGESKAPYTMAVSSAGKLRFGANIFYPPGGIGEGTWDSNGTLSANTFHHVAVTYDGATLRLYIDGVLDRSESVTLTFGTVDEPLFIGADLPGDDEYFDGIIHDVRVYERALGDAEIASLRAGDEADPQRGLAVAWYEVKDGIRWPYRARNYSTQWPTSPPRIVVASQLGSEGSAGAPTSDDAFGASAFTITVGDASPVWQRPNGDRSGIEPGFVRYEVVSFVPWNLDQAWVRTNGWSPSVFVYRDRFDPASPLDNLLDPGPGGSGGWVNHGTVDRDSLYHVVVSQTAPADPTGTAEVDPSFGLTRHSIQPKFSGPSFSDPLIYNQPDPGALGYNPNDEHALIAPSFLKASRPAAYALRSSASAPTRPFTLVQYEDESDPDKPVTRMRVYAVVEEDAATDDPRLPAFNQQYTYLYQGEAGRPLEPPYPVRSVIGASPTPEETQGFNVDGRISYYEDKNGLPWIVSGDTDTAHDIEAAWYYPLRSDFWHPTAEVGEAVSLGELTGGRPRNISYDTVWPDDVAVLKAGETLTFAGGEYATDNNTATPLPRGLPAAAAWQAGKLVFDEANVSLSPGVLSVNYLARVTPALDSREVPLALNSVPPSLQPASGNIIVDGALWRFKDLPASLQDRVYYDTITQKLGVRGLLNGRILGDGDLLAAPGAQVILQPNVLTDEDESLVAGLASDGYWTFTVSSLASLSRDPLSAGGIGLESIPGGAAPANSFGPGLAVITNPTLLQNGATGGYITVAENDHPDAPDTPVAMHVIRIETEKYRGSVAVLEPANVFDEKVSLRHTADFGGAVAELFFEWVIREEDGTELDPPPVAGWIPLTSGLGQVDAQLAGTGPTLITDNLVFCRYRHRDDPTGWSDWAGAANSYPPDEYVAQLVPGWVKRVTAAVNLFDARYSDFRSNGAPATYTSALLQAGQRWEGPVAFNPDKDAVENVGLIALYQTVLDRAEDFTIANTPGTDGVNTALLNAANRIAGLYTLMGNEAYADALDPTVGFSTVAGQSGNLPPTIHAFENQVAALLDEELTLLRGRSERGARPAYNRLPWNFTNGAGEAAYVLNYSIQDLTEDGFIDDEDARRLYPQGHGDAWGHYTMGLKAYYDLATTPNFTWSPRAEKYNIDGVVLDIDYMDERAFAKTAAAKARCGAELVDLAYRKAYTENPDGQWQGYQDTDADRAWGVFETAQRAGTGALYDWLLVNSLLPAEDTAHTGIQKVDRSTVGELGAIASEAAKIQAKLDAADRGLNPAGLDPNVVPFDIDPVLTERHHLEAATHFEQIAERAKNAATNTGRIFDHANEAAILLRQTEAGSEALRQQTIDQDRSYRNRLIELFGTPYEGMIGSGKAYPAGYNGPDLYLFAYMDRLSVGNDILDPLPTEIVRTQVVPGIPNLASDTNPFTDDDLGVADVLRNTVSTYFPSDLALPTAPSGTITLDLPRSASSYALVAPPNWGERRSPGAIQAAIQELIQAEWELRAAILYYEETADDFTALLRRFEIKSGIAAEQIRLMATTVDQVGNLRDRASDYYTAWNTLDHAREAALTVTNAIAGGIPTIVGLATDAQKPIYGIALGIGAAADVVLRASIAPLQALEYNALLDADQIQLEMDALQLNADLRAELVDLLDEIVQFVNGETDKQIPVVTALEKMRAASDRVRTVLYDGQALLDERMAFNQRVAATTTRQRYEDYTFRVFQNEALRKYRSSFDLAARYAYLAGKAYQYELNLPDNHVANAAPLLAGMLRERSLGEWQDGQPVLGGGGLAEHLAVMEANFETLKGQLGFNNPEAETNVMSLRRELTQIGLSSRVNSDWRTQLESWRVPDLWNYEFQSNGVNYGYIFRRYCRPFAPESAGAQPALVIPFSSSIRAGENWFGNPVAGGDSAFNPSNFSTKIRAAGIRFDAYNNIALSQTPQAYLVPVGNDQMFLPDSAELESRAWQVIDQRIPAPIGVSPSNLADPDWQPFTGSANGYFEDIRKFSSFRAYHDAGGWSLDEMVTNGRLVGRSVWNTQWVLIIPSTNLLYDAANPSAGIDTLIHGAPLPGFDQATAGTANRDQVGVRDIRILLQTYSTSGN